MESHCQLCGASQDLRLHDVTPEHITICPTCEALLERPEENHWRCLSESMWSDVPAVQVMVYRLLRARGDHELLEMLYLDEETLAWANATHHSNEPTRDSNGTLLAEGDSVTLIKDLDVKGAGFTAKRGTVVKNIRLSDDPKYIEGKINGTTIVLVAAYMKKLNA